MLVAVLPDYGVDQADQPRSYYNTVQAETAPKQQNMQICDSLTHSSAVANVANYLNATAVEVQSIDHITSRSKSPNLKREKRTTVLENEKYTSLPMIIRSKLE